MNLIKAIVENFLSKSYKKFCNEDTNKLTII